MVHIISPNENAFCLIHINIKSVHINETFSNILLQTRYGKILKLEYCNWQKQLSEKLSNRFKFKYNNIKEQSADKTMFRFIRSQRTIPYFKQ